MTRLAIIAGLLVAVFVVVRFVVLPMQDGRRERCIRHCVSNLRLLEDARDEVMSLSNFTSFAEVTPTMVGEHLKAGSIENMLWPDNVDMSSFDLHATNLSVVARFWKDEVEIMTGL
jgi:hypothetical protein